MDERDRLMDERDRLPWWGLNPWWEKPEYLNGTKFKPAEIHRAVQAMKKHFDEIWWIHALDDPGEAVVIRNLIGEGLMFLAFIVGTGNDLLALQLADGFERKLKELKEKQSPSTLFEFEIAGVFARAGWSMKFIRESEAKTPDFEISKGGNRLVVECKRLEEEKWEQWINDVMTAIHYRMPRSYNNQPLVVKIELDRRLSDIRPPDEKYPSLNQSLADSIVHGVVSAVAKKLEEKPDLPAQVQVNGVAKIWLRKEEPGVYSQITGCEISSVAQLRRILQNGLFRAAKQIPEDTPGIVVIHADHLPAAELMSIALDAIAKGGPSEVRRVAAMAVLPFIFLGPSRPGTLLRNQACVHASQKSEEALRDLETAFGLSSVSPS